MSSFPFSLEDAPAPINNLSEETSHSPSDIASDNAQNASSTSPAQKELSEDSNKSSTAEVAPIDKAQATHASEDDDSSEKQQIDDGKSAERNQEAQNSSSNENHASIVSLPPSKDEEPKTVSDPPANSQALPQISKHEGLEQPLNSPSHGISAAHADESGPKTSSKAATPSDVATTGDVTSPEPNTSISAEAQSNPSNDKVPSATADRPLSSEKYDTHMKESPSDSHPTAVIPENSSSEAEAETQITNRSSVQNDDNDTRDVEMKDSIDKEALVDKSGDATGAVGIPNVIDGQDSSQKDPTQESHENSEKVEDNLSVVAPADTEMKEVSEETISSPVPLEKAQLNGESKEQFNETINPNLDDKTHTESNIHVQKSEQLSESEEKQQANDNGKEAIEDNSEIPSKNNIDNGEADETSKNADTPSIPSAVDIEKLLASLAPPAESPANTDESKETSIPEPTASEKNEEVSTTGEETLEPAPEFININEFVNNKDKSKGGDNDKAKGYQKFLQDEKDYISSGHWDRFPAGSRLFVGNLSSDNISKKILYETFCSFGRIAQISIKSGYGFVQFDDASSCNEAIRMRQGMNLFGKGIHLEVSKPQSGGGAKGKAESGRGGNRRSRSRSPDRRDRRNRDNYGRRRSPNADSNRQRPSSPPPVSRRRGQDAPECQILVEDGQMIDKNFVYYVEDLLRQRGLSVDITDYPRKASLPNILRQLATEGVVAVMFLSYRGQKQNKVSIQVFHRDGEGLRKVRYDEYASVDIPIGVEVVARAKQENSMLHGNVNPISTAPPFMPLQGYPNQTALDPMNGLGNMDPATIQRLLAAIQPQMQPSLHQPPFHQQSPALGNDASQNMYNGSQGLPGSTSTPTQFSGYGTAAPPTQSATSTPEPSQQVKNIMEQLANLQKQN